MSRSRKKNPVTINAGRSNKQDKRRSNRIFRKICKMRILKDSEPPVNIKEVSDVWGFAGEFKMRIDKNDPYYNKVIRK